MLLTLAFVVGFTSGFSFQKRCCYDDLPYNEPEKSSEPAQPVLDSDSTVKSLNADFDASLGISQGGSAVKRKINGGGVRRVKNLNGLVIPLQKKGAGEAAFLPFNDEIEAAIETSNADAGVSLQKRSSDVQHSDPPEPVLEKVLDSAVKSINADFDASLGISNTGSHHPGSAVKRQPGGGGEPTVKNLNGEFAQALDSDSWVPDGDAALDKVKA